MSDAATVLLLERLLAEVQGLRAAVEAKAPPPAPPLADPEGLLTAKQAAALLGMSESWVYQRAESGELPCVRLGHALRFDPAALRTYASGERSRQANVLPLSKAR